MASHQCCNEMTSNEMTLFQDLLLFCTSLFAALNCEPPEGKDWFNSL